VHLPACSSSNFRSVQHLSSATSVEPPFDNVADLTPSNIFMAITDPLTWNESQLEIAEAIRKAVSSEPLIRTTGETALPNGPRIITSSIPLWKLRPDCITTKIIVGDLDASFPVEDGPERNFILPPIHYCAPELITQAVPFPPNMHTDIWSLGCTLFAMRAGTSLFPRTKNVYKMFLSLWIRLGESRALNEMWTAKDEYVDDDGNLMVYTPIRKSLRQVLEDVGRDIEVPIGSDSVGSVSAPDEVDSMVPIKTVTEEWTPVPTTPMEVEMFHDLLSKMLQIDPAKRIKMEKVLAHPWFNTEFESLTPED
jgi:serine/threonine protein kinase